MSKYGLIHAFIPYYLFMLKIITTFSEPVRYNVSKPKAEFKIGSTTYTANLYAINGTDAIYYYTLTGNETGKITEGRAQGTFYDTSDSSNFSRRQNRRQR